MSSPLFSLSLTLSILYHLVLILRIGPFHLWVLSPFPLFSWSLASFSSHFPHSSICHPFVQGFFWKLAWVRALTQYRLQTLNPSVLLSPHICVMCQKHYESSARPFFHCPFSWHLWRKLFTLINLSWVFQTPLFLLFLNRDESQSRES